MQQALWCTFILALATADDGNVLEVGNGLKISGTLDKTKPRQVYHVKLHEGGTYVIDMVSPNPKALDPFLRLLDASGKTVADDDDSGGGQSARLIFLAAATGGYQIEASSVDSPGVGSFTLVVRRDDSRRIEALEARCRSLMLIGEAGEALATFRDLAKARERLHGATHWRTVDARWQVRHLEKVASLSGSAKAELAEAEKLNARADQIRQMGKYAEAAPLLERALAIRHRILGDEHPDTASSYNNLAWTLDAQGKYAQTAPLYEKALAVRCKILGEEHPYTALSYQNLASNLDRQRKYAEAFRFHHRALAIYRKTLGEEYPDTARGYDNLASNLHSQGQYVEAASLREKALLIYRKTLGDGHVDTARTYNNLATDLQAQARYAEAAPLYAKALVICRKAVGEEHPHTATACNGLATNLGHQGKDAEAAVLYERALLIRRKILGEGHPDTAESYRNLAANLNHQHRHAEAAPLFEKALAIDRSVFGDEHPITARSLSGLGFNLTAQGRYTEATPLHEKTLAIYRKTFGDEHRYTARGYNELAVHVHKQGKHDEAARLYDKVLAIYRKVLSEKDPAIAVSHNNLAANLADQGRYAEALPFHEKALAIYRHTLGEEHPSTAKAYNNLAGALAAQGKYAEAEKVWTIAKRLYGIARLRNARTGLERISFATEQSAAALLSVCLARNGKPTLAWQDLEACLARGLLDEITSGPSVPRPISPGERHREQDLLARLDRLDQQILLLVTAANKDHGASGKLEKLLAERRQTGAEAANLESVVAGRQVYDLQRIQSRIPGHAALVAWVDFKAPVKAADPNGDHWACLLRRTGSPAWIKLPGSGGKGEWTKDDDALIMSFLQMVSSPANGFAERLRSHFVRQRLKPLEPALAATKDLPAVTHLLVVPVGWMASIPVDALTDRYRVSYVPSGTMLARLLEKPPRGPLMESQLFAVGDPRFRNVEDIGSLPAPPDHGVLIVKTAAGGNAAKHGLRSGDVLLSYDGKKLVAREDLTLAIEAGVGKTEVAVQAWREGKTLLLKLAAGPLEVYSSKEPAARAVLAKREGDALLRGLRAGHYPPLPGTRAEVAGIARLFPQARTLLQSDASEQQLYALAKKGELKKYRFLHFASHAEVDGRIALNSALILSQDRLPPPAEALVPDAFLDGRLTAEEISKWTRDGQPLLDADLVVLSACQSALGGAAGGEGYLGFSQALFIAGARSLVVSLWKVDDTATALLMVRFYENLLGRRAGLKTPMAKAEALAEAKRWVRNLTAKEAERLAKSLPAVERIGTASGRPRPAAASGRPYEHPYYWAAFILLGDPR